MKISRSRAERFRFPIDFCRGLLRAHGRCLTCVLSAVALSGSEAWAAGVGAAFLKIPPTAASSVFQYPLGEEDGSSWMLNPGALSREGAEAKSLLSVTYAPYFEGSKLSYAAAAHPVGEGVLGISFLRLAVDRIEGRATDRSLTGGFNASDDAVGVGYSRGGFGGHAKFLRQSIDHYSANGFALDAGWLGKPWEERPLEFGAVLRNLGPKMRFLEEDFKLPTALDLEAAYVPESTLRLGVGISKEAFTGRSAFSLAGEYGIARVLRLRAGYRFEPGRELGEVPLPMLGFALSAGPCSVEYAFYSHRDLGEVHRFSVVARFGSSGYSGRSRLSRPSARRSRFRY
ncbi:MAG: hypothetical protein WCU88_12165 [Elusimicrobiota bacterium]|jgi:hypothetical protein